MFDSAAYISLLGEGIAKACGIDGPNQSLNIKLINYKTKKKLFFGAMNFNNNFLLFKIKK